MEMILGKGGQGHNGHIPIPLHPTHPATNKKTTTTTTKPPIYIDNICLQFRAKHEILKIENLARNVISFFQVS